MGLSSADRDADFTAETGVVAVVGAVVFVGVAVVGVVFGFSVTSICLVVDAVLPVSLRMVRRTLYTPAFVNECSTFV